MLTEIRRILFKDQGGWTLIELSVIISVMGILLAVGLFAWGPVNERARRMLTVYDMDTLTKACAAYTADNIAGQPPANLGELVTGLTSAQTIDGIARPSYVTSQKWTNNAASYTDGWNNAFVYDNVAKTITSTNNGGTPITKGF